MAKAGRPLKFTPEEVAEALIARGGIMSLAAKQLGADPETVASYCKRFKVCRDARVSGVERMKDLAESTLMNLIAEGNVAATIFYLKTKAKDRGYIEPHQQIQMQAAATANGTTVAIAGSVSVKEWRRLAEERMAQADAALALLDDDYTTDGDA